MDAKVLDPAVSVVMPIFNPGDYLFQSMDSVLGQTFEDIQIVCVNDGSTDDSLSVLKEYAKQDRRVLVIDKPNGGYGHAMNTGMSVATGEYVMILEPDDFMDLRMVERLYLIAKESSCDMVKSKYWEYQTNGNVNRIVNNYGNRESHIVTNAIEDPSVIMVQPSIWSAIYRRSMLTQNAIWFNETPGASYQDTAFSFKCLVSAGRLMFVDDAYLHYRIDNEASSVKSSGKIYNVCDEFSSIESFVCTNQVLRNRLMPTVQLWKFNTYLWNLNRISDEYYSQFRDRMALEFLKAGYDGYLDQELFGKGSWNELQRIIKAYESKK